MSDSNLKATVNHTQTIYEEIMERVARAAKKSKPNNNSNDDENDSTAVKAFPQAEKGGQSSPDFEPDKSSIIDIINSARGGVLYSSKPDQPTTDHLTKQEAAAVAAMLTSNLGDIVPGSSNLKITINGKVVAETDSEGSLITVNQTQSSKKLAGHFKKLAKDPKRPATGFQIEGAGKADDPANSKVNGAEKLASIAEQDPEVSGHQLFHRIARDYQALNSSDIPSVKSTEATSPKLTDATAIMNLYATKDPAEDNYQLKDGGAIISRPGSDDHSDYQFLQVQDGEGNVEMAFVVCPDGAVLLKPNISAKLQGEISEMQNARDQGLCDDSTPLISRDQVRASAVQAFQQNLTNLGKKSIKSNLEVKADGKGATVTSKTDAAAQMRLTKTKEGTWRISSNSLSTAEIQEFNQAFAKTEQRSTRLKTVTKTKKNHMAQ
jgi:hypothetical protein